MTDKAKPDTRYDLANALQHWEDTELSKRVAVGNLVRLHMLPIEANYVLDTLARVRQGQPVDPKQVGSEEMRWVLERLAQQIHFAIERRKDAEIAVKQKD